VWHKTILHDAVWYTDSARSAGSSAVFIGTYITVLIPFHDEYLPYMQWRERGMQDNHFTMSNADYVILGEVTENVTAENVTKIVENYGENVCLVRHHNENYDRYGARVMLKVEGV
jgi:hypothetical protein